MSDHIGEATVIEPGVVAYIVRAEGPNGMLGDLTDTVPLEQFISDGWKTDRALKKVGDHALILPSS